MISSYRLGDLVFDLLTEVEVNEILTEHPNSIGVNIFYKQKIID